MDDKAVEWTLLVKLLFITFIELIAEVSPTFAEAFHFKLCLRLQFKQELGLTLNGFRLVDFGCLMQENQEYHFEQEVPG